MYDDDRAENLVAQRLIQGFQSTEQMLTSSLFILLFSGTSMKMVGSTKHPMFDTRLPPKTSLASVFPTSI
jgi:hypothetical protein